METLTHWGKILPSGHTTGSNPSKKGHLEWRGKWRKIMRPAGFSFQRQQSRINQNWWVINHFLYITDKPKKIFGFFRSPPFEIYGGLAALCLCQSCPYWLFVSQDSLHLSFPMSVRPVTFSAPNST